MKKFLALILAVAGVFGAIGVQPAGAAVLVHQQQWFLGGTRACLADNVIQDNGIGHLQMWCYNDNDTALVGVLDIWYPDYLWVGIDPGNGVGAHGQISLNSDDLDSAEVDPWGPHTYPSNYPFIFGGVRDVDSWTPGSLFKVVNNSGPSLPDEWHGPAWWGGGFVHPYDSGSYQSNKAMDFFIY